MRTAIIVSGMHRSGTSALTGVLVRCGVTPPRHLIPADWRNERGYFESALFGRLHDEILSAAGSRWDDWRRFSVDWRCSELAVEFRRQAVSLLNVEFGEATLFALKDPRICRFVPFWCDVLAEANIATRVIIPFRAPGEVAKSHSVRDGMPIEKGLLLWLRHILDAECDTRGTIRVFAAMDDLITNWRSVIERIGKTLNITWPTVNAEDIDAFLHPSLKHHNQSDQGKSDDWMTRTYDALLKLSLDPQSESAQRCLDDVRAEFEQACFLFAPLASHLDFQLQETSASTELKGNNEESLDPWLVNQDHLIESLSGRLKTVRSRLEQLQAQVSDALSV